MFATLLQGLGVQVSLNSSFSRMSSRLARLARAISTGLILAASVTAASNATAAVITYELTADTGNRWIYQYTVSAAASDPVIEEFTVFFDPARYANLLLVSAVPGWDLLAIEPDPALPADGFFDALALTGGIAPGSSVGGFSISFEFIGNGRPGEQAFDIVDPVSFATISSGFTRLDEEVELPESGTAWLMLVPLLLLLRSRRQRVNGSAICTVT